jgi:N-acetylglucosamine-6-phosphate deacetylase
MAASQAGFSSSWVLSETGVRLQRIRWNGEKLAHEPPGRCLDPPSLLGERGESYFVESLPVEVHCHSMGDVDFSDFETLDLSQLDLVAGLEGVICIPTIYLRRDRLDEFVAFMRRFNSMRRAGMLPFVAGVALEGPLLASHGGTPTATVWAPTCDEWERIASCGQLGLVYVVISPDALMRGSDLQPSLAAGHPDIPWIVRMLVGSGVRPALGHYTKADPVGSAELTEEMVDVAWSTETDLEGARVITDHLFNDMPLQIKHAFRTRRARAEREQLLASYDLPSWNLDDLPEQVGPVPAALLRLCHEGRITGCINFDGEHVDLAVAARAVELAGHDNIMLMTDRCDVARLGGQVLHTSDENSLWYCDREIVAAGSQPVDEQMANARSAGMPETVIWRLISFTVFAALGLDRGPQPAQAAGSFMQVVPGSDSRRWRRRAAIGTRGAMEPR